MSLNCPLLAYPLLEWEFGLTHLCCLTATEKASGVFVGRKGEKAEKQQVCPDLGQWLARALS